MKLNMITWWSDSLPITLGLMAQDKESLTQSIQNMTLNMCGCIGKLCKTELLKDIIKFQCPGVMFIQMKIKITKENILIA